MPGALPGTNQSLFKRRFYSFIFREREEERETKKERNIDRLPLAHPQPGHVPQLGTEAVTFWFVGHRPTCCITPVRVQINLNKNFLIVILVNQITKCYKRVSFPFKKKGN